MSMLTRVVVRLPAADRARLDGLRTRCTKSTLTRVSRADLVRFFVGRGLAAIDDAQPITEQIPPQELAVERPRLVSRPRVQRKESLRERITRELAARPGEVFAPCSVAVLVGAASDVVRNSLLVLAARGRIEKLGPGQYRALRETRETCAGEGGAS